MGAACKRCALDFKQKYIQQLIFAANLGPGQPGREGTGLHLPQKYRCAFWVSIASLVHSFGVIIVAVSNEPECGLSPCHPDMDLCPQDTCWKCRFYELSVARRKGWGQG